MWASLVGERTLLPRSLKLTAMVSRDFREMITEVTGFVDGLEPIYEPVNIPRISRQRNGADTGGIQLTDV